MKTELTTSLGREPRFRVNSLQLIESYVWRFIDEELDPFARAAVVATICSEKVWRHTLARLAIENRRLDRIAMQYHHQRFSEQVIATIRAQKR